MRQQFGLTSATGDFLVVAFMMATLDCRRERAEGGGKDRRTEGRGERREERGQRRKERGERRARLMLFNMLFNHPRCGISQGIPHTSCVRYMVFPPVGCKA